MAYAHENSGATCKTSDGGGTWTEIAPIGCPPAAIDPGCEQQPSGDPGCAQLAIDPDDPDVLYAADNPVFATTDGGATFHRVGRGLPAQLAVHAIVLDPTFPTTIYIGTDDGIYRLTGAR